MKLKKVYVLMIEQTACGCGMGDSCPSMVFESKENADSVCKEFNDNNPPEDVDGNSWTRVATVKEITFYEKHLKVSYQREVETNSNNPLKTEAV